MIDAALRYLRLRVDANDPAALQRARQVALIFSESRLGADIADTGRRYEPVGAICRLPRCRAAMARLIAGVNDDLRPRTIACPPEGGRTPPRHGASLMVP